MKLFIHFLIFSAFVSSIGTTSSNPNYITEAEFATARKNPLVVHLNSTRDREPIRLSPVGKENLELGQTRAGFGPRLWPNAIVPYTLDPTFTTHQRSHVAVALNEYHENTCIRFVPKSGTDKSWVDILHDFSPNACGAAELCMKTGPQFAKFGGNCIRAGTMVHELGHTLCTSHEQTRRDRDKWIAFNTSVCDIPSIDWPDFNRGLNKLYDYVSIQHYEDFCYNGCFLPKQPGVTRCGSDGPLSVLDIEILNEIYGCTKGCLGYRFVNKNNSPQNLVSGGKELDGTQLYICRTYHQGDIIPGKYNPKIGACYLPYGGREQKKTEDIEVLTDPNETNLAWVPFSPSSPLPSNAIRGGRTNERETLYIIQCYRAVGFGQGIWISGKYQPSAGAYISYGGVEINCNTNVKILVCDD